MAMGPLARTALSGLAPVEHGCGSQIVSIKEKSNRSWRSGGGYAPSCCLPLWGREGVTLAIIHAS
jgi:hypothetical protein